MEGDFWIGLCAFSGLLVHESDRTAAHLCGQERLPGLIIHDAGSFYKDASRVLLSEQEVLRDVELDEVLQRALLISSERRSSYTSEPGLRILRSLP